MPLIKKTLTPCDWISRMFYLFEPRLWTSVLCLLLESESKILEASRSPIADPGEKISLQCIGWKQRCEIFSWVAFQMMKFIFRRPCLNSLFDLVRQHIKWIQLCKCKLFIHVQDFEKIFDDKFLAASSLFSFYWSAHIQFLVDHKLFCVAISPLTSVHIQSCMGRPRSSCPFARFGFQSQSCLSTLLGLPHATQTGQESFLWTAHFV